MFTDPQAGNVLPGYTVALLSPCLSYTLLATGCLSHSTVAGSERNIPVGEMMQQL